MVNAHARCESLSCGLQSFPRSVFCFCLGPCLALDRRRGRPLRLRGCEVFALWAAGNTASMGDRGGVLCRMVADALVGDDQRASVSRTLFEDESGSLAAFLEQDDVQVFAAFARADSDGTYDVQATTRPTSSFVGDNKVVVVSKIVGHGGGRSGGRDIALEEQVTLFTLPTKLQTNVGQVIDIDPDLAVKFESNAMDLNDELMHWHKVKQVEVANSDSSDAVAEILSILEPMKVALEDHIDSFSKADTTDGKMEVLENATDTVDSFFEGIDALWRIRLDGVGETEGSWPYTQQRMEHLLTMLTSSVIALSQGALTHQGLFVVQFSEVEQELEMSSRLLIRWENLVRDLCMLEWQQKAQLNMRTFDAANVGTILRASKTLQGKIEYVRRIREVAEQAERLIARERGEREALQLDKVFSPFEKLPPSALRCTDEEGTEGQLLWQQAVTKHAQLIAPLESRIADKIHLILTEVLLPSLSAAIDAGQRQSRSFSHDALSHPHQVFGEFLQYKELLTLPKVAAAVEDAVHKVISQLEVHLENIRYDYEERRVAIESDKKGQGEGSEALGKNFSAVVNHLTWISQCEKMVSESLQLIKLFLPKKGASVEDEDAGRGMQKETVRGHIVSAQALATDMIKDLVSLKDELTAMWIRSASQKIEVSKSSQSSALMDFDQRTGQVRLHFSDSLIALVRETRQITALGLTVPERLKKEVSLAQRFYSHGMVLKQIANFYNTLSSQIIQCQKPMLLADALSFEKLLSSPRDRTGQPIVWTSNPVVLESYVQQLQSVSGKLTDRNRRLRNCHVHLKGIVMALFDYDLLLQKDTWAGKIREMREVFLTLEKEGFDRKSQGLWRLHWDHQIYKALEYQYCRGLEIITEILPKRTAAIVVKHHKVQLDPPLEELHMAQIKTLRSYINIPFSFKGVSESSADAGFFAGIAKSAKGIKAQAKAYDMAEQLMSRVNDELKKVADWCAPSCLTPEALDSVVDKTLRETADWESNYKVLKKISRESDMIASSIHVDSVTISLAQMKATIDSGIKVLSEAMLLALKRKTRKEREQLEDFLRNGFEILNTSATTIEEIGNARINSQKLLAKASDMVQLRRKVEEKFRLLRAVAPSSASELKVSSGGDDKTMSMDQISAKWDIFTAQLHQQESLLEAQKSQLKGQIEQQQVDLSRNTDALLMKWKEIIPKSGTLDAALVLGQLDDITDEVEDLIAEARKNVENSAAFNLAMSDNFEERLDILNKEIAATKESWSLLRKFLEEKDSFNGRDWMSFRFRLHELEGWLEGWLKSSQERKVENRHDVVNLSILQGAEKLRKIMPLLHFCKGGGFEREHWTAFFSILGLSSATLDTLKFGDLLADDVYDRLKGSSDSLRDLHTRAQGEVIIRESLNQLSAWSLEKRFMLSRYDSAAPKGQRGIALIKDATDVVTEIVDLQALVASLYTSQWFAPFKDDVTRWDTKLATLSQIIEDLTALQRKWVYLEPVFARGALPSERIRFKRVDETFCAIAARISADPMVISLLDMPQLRDANYVQRQCAQLDICQRALSDFLENKRNIFPRFYFVGDDDLLELLGQASDPDVMQAHLKKLFAGVHDVTFKESEQKGGGGGGGRGLSIVCVQSIEKEQVKLIDSVVVDEEAIERTLMTLLVCLRSSLSRYLRECVADDQLTKIQEYPSQILSLSEQVLFTQECEAMIKQDPRLLQSGMREKLTNKLTQYTSMDVSANKILRLKVQSLILDIIHELDIVDQLVSNAVCDANDWFWMKQLRYVHRPEIADHDHDGGGELAEGKSTLAVKMVEAQFEYSYEYQGNAGRLVHTPLTDKCYLTLTQAMTLGYGGNPYGPAGTGKTESVKALGQCLGRQVLVFNCDEEFNYESMGRIFIGLMRCGAWGCFDEFNRLEEDVLSAISQQIQQIQVALKENRSEVVFSAKGIPLDRRAAIFVTLNPAAKGYGGRRNLPDNLKQLFRSVAMSKPDNELISEVLLLSVGYSRANAPKLGHKLVSLFDMSKFLLSNQQHYDWGLRALKNVLKDAGILLMRQRKEANKISFNEDEEVNLLLQAICSSTIPKLTTDDRIRFENLLKGVFDRSTAPDVENSALVTALRNAAKRMGLAHNESQIEKAIQLHLACSQRIGIIIVGPAGSGKSTIWKLLHAAYAEFNPSGDDVAQGQGIQPPKRSVRPKVHIINPKAMNRKNLIGHLDSDTREWFDGVLSASCRKVTAQPLYQKSWLLCDGDIDPEWIESLNSVLDDNRLLTLPNGERIQFAHNVNFIFECSDLQFASPATVSRCGVLYTTGNLLNDVGVCNIFRSFATKDVGAQDSYMNFITKAGKEKEGFVAMDEIEYRLDEWTRQDDFEDTLMDIVDAVMPDTVMPVSRMCVLRNVWNLSVHHLLASESGRRNFMASICAGILALLPPQKRDVVSQNVLARLCNDLTSLRQPLVPPRCVLAHDLVSRVDEAEYDYGDEGPLDGQMEGEHGTDAMDRALLTVSQKYAVSVLVPLLMRDCPIILCGPSGCGKATIVEKCVSHLPNTRLVEIHCSTNSSSSEIVSKLKDLCDEVSTANGKVLRPKSSMHSDQSRGTSGVSRSDANASSRSAHLVVLIRGAHTPSADNYRTVQLIQLLQQIAMYNGIHDSSNEYLLLQNIQFVCTLETDKRWTPASRKALISDRFTSWARVICINDHARDELITIVEACMPKSWSPDFREKASRFALALYDNLTSIEESAENDDVIDEADGIAIRSTELLRWVRGLRRMASGEDSDAGSGDVSHLIRFLMDEAMNVFAKKFDPRSKEYNMVESAIVSAVRSIGTEGLAVTDGMHDEENASEGKGALVFGPRIAIGSASHHLMTWKAADWTSSCASAAREMSHERLSMKGIAVSNQFARGIATISRAITEHSRLIQTGVILMGSTGVGRKTMLSIASHMCKYDLMSPKIPRNYGLKQLKSDLKTAIAIAGGWITASNKDASSSEDGGQKVVFLLEDHHLSSDTIVPSVVYPLLAGTPCLDIPGLFQKDELEQIVAQFQSAELSYEETLTDFSHKVSGNLQVVLSLNNDAEGFDDLMLANPALKTRCMMLCFSNHWSKETQLAILKENLKRAIPVQTSKLKKLNIGSRRASISKEAGKGSGGRPEQMQGGSVDKDKSAIDQAVSAIMKVHMTITEGHAFDVQRACSKALDAPYRMVTMARLCAFVWKKKRNTLSREKRRLESGLDKLSEAEALVDKLRNEAEEQRRQLKEKRAQADTALGQIAASMAQANESRKEVDILSKSLREEEADLAKQKEGIEGELASVQPVVDAARKAIGQIRSDHLSEIKSLKVPPDAIRDVLEGVLVLMGQTDTSWSSMKKFLSSRSVKENIIHFDARQITPVVRDNVTNLVRAKGKSFEHATIYRVSVAAAPMAAWVKANIKYSLVLERIAPLEESLQELSLGLEQSRMRMDQCQKDLEDLDAHVVRLKGDFGQRTAEAQTLEAHLQKADDMLKSAVTLLSQLSDEKNRWSDDAKFLGSQIEEIPLQAVLSASMITYLLGEHEASREKALRVWCDVLGFHPQDTMVYDNGLAGDDSHATKASAFDIKRFLSNETELLSWKRLNLPGDDLSAENAIGIVNCSVAALSTPLIVDSSGRAITWLHKYLSNQSNAQTNKKAVVESVRFSDARAMNAIELAIRFGKVLVLSEVDTIESVLYPIIRKELTCQGGSMQYEGADAEEDHSTTRTFIQLGDKSIDYNPSFRIYIIAQTPELMRTVPQSAAAHMTIANFAITREALERQLLTMTIEHDQPELERQRVEALGNAESLRVQLIDLEEQLLIALADSQGNLLENRALIDSLNETKTKALEVKTLLAESSKLQRSIDVQRDSYSPIATRAAAMYFLLQRLEEIHHAYRFSITVFLRLFEQSLKTDSIGVSQDKSNASKHVGSRIAMINIDLVRRVLSYVTRGLFKADRLTFSVFLAHQLAADDGEEAMGADKDFELWKVLLGEANASQSLSPSQSARSDFAIPRWVPAHRSSSFAMLCQSLDPSTLKTWKITSNDDCWNQWISSTDAEMALMEGQNGLPAVSPLETLILVSTLRPDRLESAFSTYAGVMLGLNKGASKSKSMRNSLMAMYNPFSFAQLAHKPQSVLSWSSEDREPIFFLTANDGSDPSQELEEFAIRQIGESKYHQLAMGQGQCSEAIKLLRKCAREGHWLCLKNVHFVSSWLPKLQHEIQSIPSDSWSADTRVYLTAFPDHTIPVHLLESSLKITFEAPPGIKKNILRTYSDTWTAPYVSQPKLRSEQAISLRAQMLFVLAWFHAIVQERRAYIPHGWSKFYEFSFTDLKSGADIIDMFSVRMDDVFRVSEGRAPQWKFLQGLLLDAIYGGRVDNPQDLHVLNLYLQQYFNDDVFGTAQHRVKPIPGTAIEEGDRGLIVPSSKRHDDYLRLLMSIPEDINANGKLASKAYHLPVNINRSAQRLAGSRVLQQLRLLSAQTGHQSGVEGNAHSGLDGLDALAALVTTWDTISGRSRVSLPSSTNNADPVESFFCLEMSLAVDLVATIEDTMAAAKNLLRKAKKENRLNLGSDLKAVIRGEIPLEWSKIWDMASDEDDADSVGSIPAYLNTIFVKIAYMNDCYKQIKVNPGMTLRSTLVSATSIDLCHFFRPKCLFMAMKQQAAQNQNCPMHDLALHTAWGGDAKAALANLMVNLRGIGGRSVAPKLDETTISAFTVGNIIIQGAHLVISGSQARLQEVSEQDDIMASAPTVAIGWVRMDKTAEVAVSREEASIDLPFYESMNRSIIIERLSVPVEGTPGNSVAVQKWTLRGVALFYQPFSTVN